MEFLIKAILLYVLRQIVMKEIANENHDQTKLQFVYEKSIRSLMLLSRCQNSINKQKSNLNIIKGQE